MHMTRSDPRLREQFNTIKEPGSTALGYFGKSGDTVKIYVMDTGEAEFFLGTGQVPVGRVIEGRPEHDFAEVEVIGLCRTEPLFVANIHMAKIPEDEYSIRADRILDAREEALRQVQATLHTEVATVVWRKVMVVGGERCLCSATDTVESLVVRVMDPKTKKRMQCNVSWDMLSKVRSNPTYVHDVAVFNTRSLLSRRS